MHIGPTVVFTLWGNVAIFTNFLKWTLCKWCFCSDHRTNLFWPLGTSFISIMLMSSGIVAINVRYKVIITPGRGPGEGSGGPVKYITVSSHDHRFLKHIHPKQGYHPNTTKTHTIHMYKDFISFLLQYWTISIEHFARCQNA